MTHSSVPTGLMAKRAPVVMAWRSERTSPVAAGMLGDSLHGHVQGGRNTWVDTPTPRTHEVPRLAIQGAREYLRVHVFAAPDRGAENAQAKGLRVLFTRATRKEPGQAHVQDHLIHEGLIRHHVCGNVREGIVFIVHAVPPRPGLLRRENEGAETRTDD